MSQPCNPRISKAFSAMKSLGIKSETVKPVLKKLLKLYDKRWELIEEDNYRTLADAIFESEEEKEKAEIKFAAEDDPPEPPSNTHHGMDQLCVEHDPPEPLLKKHRGIEDEDEASSTMDNGNMLDMQNGEKPQSSSTFQSGVSTVPTPTAPKIDASTSSVCAPPRNKEQYPITTNSSPVDQHMATRWVESPGDHHVKSADNTNVTGHAGNDEVPESEQPFNDLKDSPVKAPGKRVTTEALNCEENMPTTIDLASSACGSVKVSLKCIRAFEQLKGKSPSLDSILAIVESKSQNSYNNMGSQFSLRECLKELCQSYVELAGNPGISSPSRRHPGDHLDPIRHQNNKSVRSGHTEQHLKKMMSSGSGSSTSLMASHQQPPSLSLFISDISKATETVKISLVDEIGEEKEQLPDFVYIPSNIVYQSAYLHVSLARIADEDCCSGCRRDCLSSVVSCACARDTGGEFAYTPEGLVKEEFLRKCILMNENPQKYHFYYCQDCPLERAKNNHRPKKCKGHLIRKFIKECWRKCGCNMSCGNRVVQRGISRNLQVFLTSDCKGWGVRTLEELPKGAFVCEYVGEILTNLELFERNKQNSKDRHTYPVLLDADWGSESVLKDEDALCLDATHYGNVARFINHRCEDANLIEIPVEVENPDHHYYHLAFFTKRKVAALEELTWDYKIDFSDQNHPIKAFQCRCRSAFCRDKKGKGRRS